MLLSSMDFSWLRLHLLMVPFHKASFKTDAKAYTCVSDRVFLGTPYCFGMNFKLCTRLRMCGAVHDLEPGIRAPAVRRVQLPNLILD